LNSSSCLRILHIARSLPAHLPGGLERHVEDLALGLAAAGCETHLLTAPLPPAERQRLEAAGLRLHAISRATPARYTVRYLLGVGRRIDELLAAHPFDLIHAQEFALGCWTPPPTAPPLVLTVHGTITSETPLHPDVYRQLSLNGRARAWLHFGRRYLYAPLWRRTLRRADRILVDSVFSHDELVRLIPECRAKIHHIPLAVREPGALPPERHEARRRLGWQGTQLLTTGRLEWQKGHEIALEALAGLRQWEWHYTIAGTGANAEPLRRRIGDLNLGDRVTLAGWVSEESKARMLAGADLFLWPERTHPAFGLVGVESMLHSTPVLAIRRGAIPEILSGQAGEGWLVEDCDPQSFAARLARLLAHPDRLAAAREGLRQATLDHFSFATMIQSVLAEYQGLAR
jgi:glycosyltransferase involved in cell wall biosynthesis